MKRFRISIIFFGLWLADVAIYLASIVASPLNGYATSTDGAKTMGGFMRECSGEVFKYGTKGYRCDGYGPSRIGIFITLFGIVAFLLAVTTLFIELTKNKKTSLNH